MVSAAALAGSTEWSLSTTTPKDKAYRLVAQTDRDRILKAASVYIALKPQTITAFPSERSPGGPHDYFSQADYFWPDPKNPEGPYVNRDGQSNPANFNDHRKAMIALSIQMPALTAAWLLTGDRKYGQHACDHLRAWFVTPATRMNPNLEFSQGVHGVSTGRSYGIIDTLHLVEVARAASVVAPTMLSAEENSAVKNWFRSYLQWMKTSEKGKQERAALNNTRRAGPSRRRSLLVSLPTARPAMRCASNISTCFCQTRWEPTARFQKSWPGRNPTATPSSISMS
jgi:hypothetical protein